MNQEKRDENRAEPGHNSSQRGLRVVGAEIVACLIFGPLVMLIAFMTRPPLQGWIIGMGVLFWLASGLALAMHYRRRQ